MKHDVDHADGDGANDGYGPHYDEEAMVEEDMWPEVILVAIPLLVLLRQCSGQPLFSVLS
jgi:hypothetical protein